MNLTKIYIPNSLVNIDINAFAGCPNINKIEIDPSNTNLKLTGDATLTDSQMTKYYYISRNIETLNILPTINEIPQLFIQICQSLTVLTVDGNNQQFSTDGKILYSKDKIIAFACCGGVSSASLHQDCQIINNYCFSMAKKIETLNFLGNNLREIRDYAFSNTFALKFVRFPNSVTTFFNFALYGTSIEYLSFDANSQLNFIGDYCFMTSNLTSAEFGDKLNYVGRSQTLLYLSTLSLSSIAQTLSHSFSLLT